MPPLLPRACFMRAGLVLSGVVVLGLGGAGLAGAGLAGAGLALMGFLAMRCLSSYLGPESRKTGDVRLRRAFKWRIMVQPENLRLRFFYKKARKTRNFLEKNSPFTNLKQISTGDHANY